jgi:SAM-dependent methyltransferase
MAAMSRFYAEGLAVPFYEEKVLRADRKIRQEKIFNHYLERLAQLELQPHLGDRALLDIGCASGLFLKAARNMGMFSRYAGVEANGPSAAEAEKHCFPIYQAMFEDVIIPPASYDVITCFSMFQFICEPVAFLEKCKNLLRPGGWVILTSPSGWAPDILLLQDPSPVLPGHMLQVPDPDSFQQLCSQVGLSAVQVEAIGRLDVQLVREAWRKCAPDLSNPLTDFLHRVFVDLLSEKMASDLQDFLKRYRLSGHLWMQTRCLRKVAGENHDLIREL